MQGLARELRPQVSSGEHVADSARFALERLRGGGRCDSETLPFHHGDVTAGTENELATSIAGGAERSDFAGQLREAAAGEPWEHDALAWLAGAGAETARHDHDWVRLPLRLLGNGARSELGACLAERGDRRRYFVQDGGEACARIPVSHALHLALVDALAEAPEGLKLAERERRRLGAIFGNDNTAPEVLSGYIARDGIGRSLGAATADENALRFLLIQALSAWINNKLGLRASGQTLRVFAASNPPERLEALAKVVPAEVYRRLLMNPCLSGFADGENKAGYMHLCHETLSRSHVIATARVRAAGLGMRQSVAKLPVDTTLLNNGVHVSLGSVALAEIAQDSPSGPATEKYFGDLVSKFFEHFLPLFVGTFSAAPSRLAVAPLRPETTLGLLPLALTSVQLRQTWSAWKRKAGLLGALRGDVVPDARLLDYFTALPSTETCHAHDGALGSQEALQAALERAGVYRRDMAFYDLYRLRSFSRMGYSGFEGRFHSVFPGFARDMAPAVDLQRLITACAWWAVSREMISHSSLPDDPQAQGERRQLLFHSAVGIATVPVRRTSRSAFLLSLVAETPGVRVSMRQPTHFSVPLAAYRLTLCDWLERECAPVVAALGAGELLREVRARAAGEDAASTRLLGAANAEAGREPGRLVAAMERHLRTGLRVEQTREGLSVLEAELERRLADPDGRGLLPLPRGATVGSFITRSEQALDDSRPDVDGLASLIAVIASVMDRHHAQAAGQ